MLRCVSVVIVVAFLAVEAIGIVVITQILTTPGVDLVGPLPAEIQSHVVFTAGVGANSKVPDAAKQQLIKFLTGPAAIPLIGMQGMEPPSPQQAVDRRNHASDPSRISHQLLMMSRGAPHSRRV